MSGPLEVHQNQRAVTEFFVAKGETLMNIHTRLKNIER